MDKAQEFKDGEVGYCTALIASRGNRNVPREHVAAYLDLQRSDASRQGYNEAAEALRILELRWEEILATGEA